MTIAEQLHNSATHTVGHDPSCPACLRQQIVVSIPRHGKKDALETARRGTQYLQQHGCSQILMIAKLADGWNVEVPQDVAQTWPNLMDLLTE
jgi:hypothetical protein